MHVIQQGNTDFAECDRVQIIEAVHGEPGRVFTKKQILSMPGMSIIWLTITPSWSKSAGFATKSRLVPGDLSISKPFAGSVTGLRRKMRYSHEISESPAPIADSPIYFSLLPLRLLPRFRYLY